MSVWVKQLSSLLQQALGQMDKTHKREVNKFYNFLYTYYEVMMFMDVTERRIGRSGDYGVQKQHYSGKKGCHTLKNLLITNLAGEILYRGRLVKAVSMIRQSMSKHNFAFLTNGTVCGRTWVS